MLRSLTSDERDAFLAEPVTGVMLLRRKDGTPLLSPIWHEWVDGTFYFVVGVGDVKWRSVLREPTIAYAVYGQNPPYPGVEAHGRAEVRETGVEARARLARIATRYVGTNRAKRFMDAIADDELGTIQMVVEMMRTFDQSEVEGLGHD
jgi:hypothetical protein